MLSLDADELRLLQEFAAATDRMPVRMSVFLQRHFFNEATGRALILQPNGAFGYYYLLRGRFDQPDGLAAEIGALLDLITLIARLRQRHLIYLFPTEATTDTAMLFVSDLFQNPKPSTAHIILNARGDYTFQPDAIQDQNDKVIYRGIRLDDDFYALLREQTRGLVHVTPDVRARLAAPPKLNFWRTRLVALIGVLAVLIGLVDAGIWWRYYRHSPMPPISANTSPG